MALKRSAVRTRYAPPNLLKIWFFVYSVLFVWSRRIDIFCACNDFVIDCYVFNLSK